MSTTGETAMSTTIAPAPAPAVARTKARADHRGGLGRRGLVEKTWFTLFRGAAVVNGLALLVICAFLAYNGLPAITWEFLTEVPRNSMTEGGIWPCIVGTAILACGAMVVAFPLGVASAIYLNEYATNPRLVRVIRLGINNLAGVPSVVFGLFGLAFFVTFMGLGVSILAGVLTLGALVLPVIIGTAEEALRSVPDTYREASLGLGATKWQTISRVVLPAALPGMLTGSILGLSRAAGETAAIMFTAAVFFTPTMPSSIFSKVMALPYHIYVLATAGTEIEVTRPLQYGTALVLIALVLGMNLVAIWLRARLQKKL
jgi:phosphate transport system permease protein